MKNLNVAVVAFLLCSAAAFAADSAPMSRPADLTAGTQSAAQTMTLEQLRQAIFASTPGQVASIGNGREMLPRPVPLDSCDPDLPHCGYIFCLCTERCGTCGIQTFTCNIGLCICNPPC